MNETSAIKVGIQLGSLLEGLKERPEETLKNIYSAGYRCIEGVNRDALTDAGFGFGGSVKQLRNLIESSGLQVSGCRINPLMEESLDEILDFHEAAGTRRIGTDVEFFPYNNVEYIKRRCDIYNRIAAKCRARGMGFYYHNHFQEFQMFGQKSVLDYIMELTDPELVDLELDVYWAARSGHNPVSVIHTYADRIVYINVMDFPEDSGESLIVFNNADCRTKNINFKLFRDMLHEQAMVWAGNGVLPLKSYFYAAKCCENLECIFFDHAYDTNLSLYDYSNQLTGLLG